MNNTTAGCPKCAGQAACWCPPLPTIPYAVTDRLGKSLREVPGPDFVAAVDAVRAAQHAATRRAVLEEIQRVMNTDNPLGNTPTHIVEQTRDYITTHLAGGDQ